MKKASGFRRCPKHSGSFRILWQHGRRVSKLHDRTPQNHPRWPPLSLVSPLLYAHTSAENIVQHVWPIFISTVLETSLFDYKTPMPGGGVQSQSCYRHLQLLAISKISLHEWGGVLLLPAQLQNNAPIKKRPSCASMHDLGGAKHRLQP